MKITLSRYYVDESEIFAAKYLYTFRTALRNWTKWYWDHNMPAALVKKASPFHKRKMWINKLIFFYCCNKSTYLTCRDSGLCVGTYTYSLAQAAQLPWSSCQFSNWRRNGLVVGEYTIHCKRVDSSFTVGWGLNLASAAVVHCFDPDGWVLWWVGGSHEPRWRWRVREGAGHLRQGYAACNLAVQVGARWSKL